MGLPHPKDQEMDQAPTEQSPEADYPSTHKRCRNCGEVMPWEEYCECLKATGRDIRRKAREMWDQNASKSPQIARRGPKAEEGGLTPLFGEIVASDSKEE